MSFKSFMGAYGIKIGMIISFPYMFWIVNSSLPAWVKLIAFLLNPVVLVGCLLMWYNKEQLETAYYMFKYFWLDRYGERKKK